MSGGASRECGAGLSPQDAGVVVHEVEPLDVLEVHQERVGHGVRLDDDVHQDVQQVVSRQVDVRCGSTTGASVSVQPHVVAFVHSR